MIDFGFDKIALIGAVALIVIGPEKLPKVARTVGHFMGKAQRYVAEVKAEVNRSIELDELKKMRSTFEDAARNVETSIHSEISQTKNELQTTWDGHTADLPPDSGQHDGWQPPPPQYKHPKKNWRVKRSATPRWYKQRQSVRTHAQSGAARVARFRPPRSSA